MKLLLKGRKAVPPVTESVPPVQEMLAAVKVPLPLPTLDAVTEGAAAGLPIVLKVPIKVNTQVGPLKVEGAATGPPASAGILGTEASGPAAGEPDKIADGAGAGAAVTAVRSRQATKQGSIIEADKSPTTLPACRDYCKLGSDRPRGASSARIGPVTRLRGSKTQTLRC